MVTEISNDGVMEIICSVSTGLSSQMEKENATTATAQPPTTSFSDYVTILEVVTQGQKAYPDL